MSIELTVADVLAELEMIGADLATTTFEVHDQAVMRIDGTYEIARQADGTVVVSFLVEGGACFCDHDEDDENEDGANGGGDG